MSFFRMLWGFDAFIGLVVLYFFIAGLADGSVSSFNLGLWLLLLAAVAAILYSSTRLRACNRNGLATGVLCLLAVPGLLFLLFALILLIGEPRWN